MIRSQLEFVAKCKDLCADIDKNPEYHASATLSRCGTRLYVWVIPSVVAMGANEPPVDNLLDLSGPNLDEQAHIVELLEELA